MEKKRVVDILTDHLVVKSSISSLWKELWVERTTYEHWKKAGRDIPKKYLPKILSYLDDLQISNIETTKAIKKQNDLLNWKQWKKK